MGMLVSLDNIVPDNKDNTIKKKKEVNMFTWSGMGVNGICKT